MTAALDTLNWHPSIEVVKFDQATVENMIDRLGHEPDGDEIDRLLRANLFEPDDVVVSEGNLLTTVGLNRITNLITGGGGAAFNNAQGLVGVGASTTAAAVADTKLGADAGSALYKSVDSGYPTQSNGNIVAYGTFQTGEANFAWNEWGLAIATGTITAGATLANVGTSPILLNHKIQGLGTKASGIWQLQATITLS